MIVIMDIRHYIRKIDKRYVYRRVSSARALCFPHTNICFVRHTIKDVKCNICSNCEIIKGKYFRLCRCIKCN